MHQELDVGSQSNGKTVMPLYVTISFMEQNILPEYNSRSAGQDIVKLLS